MGEYAARANLSITPGGSTLTIGKRFVVVSIVVVGCSTLTELKETTQKRINSKLSLKAASAAAAVTQSEKSTYTRILQNAGEATSGDSGGYRCELALGGDRPRVEHMVVVKEPQIQQYELLEEKDATTTVAATELVQKELSSDESGTVVTTIPPIQSIFTSPSTHWSPRNISTFTIYETSQASKDSLEESPTPIPPIFLNIPEYEDESEYEENNDGSDYMGDDDAGEDTENLEEDEAKEIQDELLSEPRSSLASFSVDSKIATTNLKPEENDDDDEKEKDWPEIPPLTASSQAPFILVTISSENIKSEEQMPSSIPSLSPPSSSSAVHAVPTSDHFPLSVDEPVEEVGVSLDWSDGCF